VFVVFLDFIMFTFRVYSATSACCPVHSVHIATKLSSMARTERGLLRPISEVRLCTADLVQQVSLR